ncbi:hydrolase, NUDIX family protein [Babesia divergens]|uniref:Hydrolase, NUDIX family protein n=1 Tax=Babesia divergens TaxID=32595 RepID=A0AAD9LEJ5_BABDI|nr:hydrolase, NUDIX family protein [Babesia divergens]
MNSGNRGLGASYGGKLADELCMTIKGALGIRSPVPPTNAYQHDASVGSWYDVPPRAPECVPDAAALGGTLRDEARPSSVYIHDELVMFDDNEISEARATFLKARNSVDSELLDKALSDCYGRFVALLPEEVLRDHVHLCFYLQEAYWWYCDRWAARHPEKLPPMQFRSFLSLVCQDCELLRSFITPEERSKMYDLFREYSRRIPLRGGILLNETCDKVLLVQSYNSHHWTFPRGKTDESETDSSCAAREIMEEVGLDVRHRINPAAYLESEIEGRSVKLFIVPGINEQETVHPKSDYEIKHIKWVPLTLLSDMLNTRTPSFLTFHVRHFVKGLWEFVQEFRSGRLRELFPKEYGMFVKLSTSSVTGTIAPHMTFRGTGQASPESRRTNAPYTPPQHKQPSNRNTGNFNKQTIACQETFGESSGWSADEMFRVNREKFGVESTYTEDGTKKGPTNKKHRELIPFGSDSLA